MVVLIDGWSIFVKHIVKQISHFEWRCNCQKMLMGCRSPCKNYKHVVVVVVAVIVVVKKKKRYKLDKRSSCNPKLDVM